MIPVVDAFMSGQRPRYIGPELRGPADADGFRVKVGRYGDRFYHDPLPGDHIASAWDAVVPSVSTVKKASGNDWSFVALERVAKALETEKYRNLAGWPYADRYEALKAINKIGLNGAGQRGSNVHLGFDARLHDAPCPITDDMPGADYRNAIDQFFHHYNPTLIAAEFVCIHRTLNGVGYGGTADAIIEIDGPGSRRMRFIVDWKSRGADSEHGAYPEEAAQVAAYHGADYIIVEGRDGPERRLMPTLDGGLIVSIKPDGCRIYPVDLDKGFAHWSALHAWWVARRDEREAIGRQWPARKIVPGDGTPISATPGTVEGEAGPGVTITPSTPVSPADKLQAELRSITKSTYLVNEKRPPSYERKWKLHILHSDDTTATYWGDDSDKGQLTILRQALTVARNISPQAPMSAAVNAGAVGSSADQPPHPPVTIGEPWTNVAECTGGSDCRSEKHTHGCDNDRPCPHEALAWASQPASTPLPALPDHPDEGGDLDWGWDSLKEAYELLPATDRAWISRLVGEAQRANVGFHSQRQHTARRYRIISALVELAPRSLDDDILRALVTAALDIDAPLDPRHTPGHCVGSLDAAAAQRFATLVDDYVAVTA